MQKVFLLLGTMVFYAFTQTFLKADRSEITFPVTEELKGLKCVKELQSGVSLAGLLQSVGRTKVRG